jgi:hypothetical protein
VAAERETFAQQLRAANCVGLAREAAAGSDRWRQPGWRDAGRRSNQVLWSRPIYGFERIRVLGSHGLTSRQCRRNESAEEHVLLGVLVHPMQRAAA